MCGLRGTVSHIQCGLLDISPAFETGYFPKAGVFIGHTSTPGMVVAMVRMVA
jgi:hypothetical protein